MLRVGVINNSRSQRNRRRLAEMRDFLAGRPETRHVILDGIAGLSETLADFARREVGVLALGGGDGTVQATLTALFTERPFERMPFIAVLPRGTTNMIAADAGVGPRQLGRFLDLARDGQLDPVTVERRVLRLANARGRAPQYGMFFGGAGIYRAVLACRAKVHPWHVVADAAAALTLGGLLLRWLVPGAQGGGIVRGDPIGVTVDGRELGTRSYLLVLATTLDRLLMGSRPFWGDDSRGVRFTVIGYPPRRLACHVRKVLYGGAARHLPEGYDSLSADSVRLAMDCPFILDGELFEAERDRPVELTAHDRVRLVRL
jgi:hypothetical protein